MKSGNCNDGACRRTSTERQQRMRARAAKEFALAYVSVLRFSAVVGSACLMILLPPCMAIVHAFSTSTWHALAWLVIWPFVAALGVTILRPPRQPTSTQQRS